MDQQLKTLASTTAARSVLSQTAQGGVGSLPAGSRSSASLLLEHFQDSDDLAQTPTPESMHVRNIASQRPRAPSIHLDESGDDDNYNYEIDACDNDIGGGDVTDSIDDNDAIKAIDVNDDNDSSAEYDIRFECSTHGNSESEGETIRRGSVAVNGRSAGSTSGDDALNTTLGRGFARKRAKHNQAHSSCDRCKSNLNGKLIVRCACCSFRRHLYCFTPPLKQHPAFLEQVHVTALGTKVRVRPTTDAIANWSCDACRQHGHSGRLTEQRSDSGSTHERTLHHQPLVKKDAKQQIRQHKIASAFTTSTHPVCSSELEATAAISPVQEQWRVDGTPWFDWSAFRAEKVKRIALHTGTDEVSSDELVYYSKPFAGMKTTALDWMNRAAQRKRLERNQFQRKIKKRPPPKRDVMHRLTEAEREQLERSLLSQQLAAHNEIRLFDDSLTYQFDISASRIRRLREARISVIQSPHTAANDAVHTVEVLAELVEAVCMDLEDDDVQCSVSTGSALDTAQTKWAALVIQSAVIRKAYTAKERIRVQHSQMVHTEERIVRGATEERRICEATEERKVREATAHASVRVLRLCVLFIMLLVRNLRNAQVKKLLLRTLQEASEDTKVADSTEDESEKRRKLAAKRIQRFFAQRVRRYVHLKKRMMSRRIRLWWKRRRALWKWRDAADVLRDRWRERASRVIQVAYRRYRAKKAFREILDKHALRKVKLFLRHWLMSRLIEKEKVRVEIYAIGASLGLLSDAALSELADATVDKVLHAVGMELYAAGDFWNAASVLDRARKLSCSSFNWEDRLALAYSHHMTWYSSYDRYNLQTAFDMYCVALNDLSQQAGKAGMSEAVDPFILQDAAIVMMQLEDFGGSLRLLASLIQFFVQSESFPLWLLLAAVQLQQRGEWEQSVEYLTYVQDMPPNAYLERDILCLCAIGLEHQRREAGTRAASREAWSAALRQWRLKQKTEVMMQNESGGNNPWSQPNEDAGTSKRPPHVTLWKWGMLNDFAQRAATQGHYLLACRLMLYMLEIRPGDNDDTDGDRSERAAVWWSLADAFRHLGHLDLYIDATRRSHQCVGAGALGDEQESVAKWRSEAEAQARSFRDGAERLSTIEFMRKLRAQYAQREVACG